jgi:hypothetical protein
MERCALLSNICMHWLEVMLQAAGLGDGGVQNIRWAVDSADTSSNPSLKPTCRQRCAGSSGRSPF